MTMRLFAALALPPPVHQAVTAVQQDLDHLGTRARWLAADTLHLTLRFVGPTPDDRVHAAQQALDRAAALHPPLELALEGGGSFGRGPSVLWIGVGGALLPLHLLANDLDDALATIGVGPRDKPFRAHVTIARNIQRYPEPARQHLESLAPHARWRADALVLYQSHTEPGGARYEALHRAPLAG